MKVKEIRSKITNELLHLVIRDITSSETATRTNIINDNEFLQLAILKMRQNDTFKPHKHIFKHLDIDAIAQESWVVLKGRVQVTYYDLDDTIVDIDIIEQNDVSLTLHGGHNYLALDDDTFVLEYKTGPYLGLEKDKKFITEG